MGWPATDLVQGWLTNPASNNGVALLRKTPKDVHLSFMSRESVTCAPFLLVEYSLPVVTPTRVIFTPVARRLPAGDALLPQQLSVYV